jgi:hypothetical protein
MTTAGHVVMISCDAVVVKNPDGSINGAESYVTVLDQTNKWTEYENEMGDKATIKANVDAKWTFDYLFEKKGARRIYAYTEDNNVPSQRLCERLGMRREGLFLEFVSFVDDGDGNPVYENTYQYAILKKEWDKAQKQKNKI